MAGLDPLGRSYISASFADRDDDPWIVEEIADRLPGRQERHDAGALGQLLFETPKRHGAFNGIAPPHDSWDWYGAFIDAREQGSTPRGGGQGRRALHAGVRQFVVASA